MTDNPLDRIERIKKLLAADVAQPLKDGAGIIIPAGVDAAHRAAAYRRSLEAIHDSTGPEEAHNRYYRTIQQ